MRMARDPLWEQVKLEAKERLEKEPLAGPQLYQLILSQPSLLDAVVAIVAHEIETELMPAPSLRGLCLEFLHHADNHAIHLDVVAAALRSPSDGTSALTAILFNKGLHALVCYRVGHNMWKAGRTGLAYYMQSTVSLKYSADIHPAAQIGSGIYLNCGGGVVIGETAVVGNDVILLQGVTLGGTGKEAGDRHPKIGNGVLLHDGVTVLGNIQVGDGAVITAKSIVTKPVPPLARVSGIPAKVKSYREPIPSNNDNTSIDTNDHLIMLEQQIYLNYNPLGQQS
jgi:serine O-acetyltransferase